MKMLYFLVFFPCFLIIMSLCAFLDVLHQVIQHGFIPLFGPRIQKEFAPKGPEAFGLIGRQTMYLPANLWIAIR
jgi:hypothetical protein